jgi:glycosyltransferase involved in cell wall biosynthesis
MNILIVNNTKIPVSNYGGTERVIWYLGKELNKMGHKVFYLVSPGSYSDFATVLNFDKEKSLSSQIPDYIDFVHFNINPEEEIRKPYLITKHGNFNDLKTFDVNTVFVSKNHANRFGSSSFIYNGLDWDDYGKPDLTNNRNYFHFLGNAAWRIKNVKGAIDIIKATKKEKLKVLGGNRLNINMGFRFTLSPRIGFCGMVGGEKKNKLLEGSKGLIFPVRWNEPFGLAIIESLYFGCPVFGTPYGSLPELVNSEIGYLSKSSKILTQEVENIEDYSRVKCHDYAVELFNSRKMAESYLEKYAIVLNGGQLNKVPPKLIEIQTKKFLEWTS